MNTNDTILGAVEPDIIKRLVTRREAIMKGAAASSTVIAGLAMASAPVAFATLSREAFAQAPAGVQAVLNFALMLEIFENEFYKAVLGTSSLPAQNAVFAPVRALLPASAVTTVQQIQKHEAAHVATLTGAGAVNTLNLTAASFDFTGGRGSGSGPFARAGSEVNFLLLTAQGAEDTGVRAYKGQAGTLLSAGSTAILESALRIHSVEARHASKLRRMRRALGATTVKYSGTISGASAGAENITNPPAAAVSGLTAIYAGEDNTTQAGINITTLSNLPSGIDVNAASEAFDEPLTMAQVIAIVQPFFIPALS